MLLMICFLFFFNVVWFKKYIQQLGGRNWVVGVRRTSVRIVAASQEIKLVHPMPVQRMKKKFAFAVSLR